MPGRLRQLLCTLAPLCGLACGGGEGAVSGALSAGGMGAQSIALDAELEYATDFAFIPGRDGELLLSQRSGRLLHYRLDGDSLTRLGEVTLEGIHVEEDCGLIALAFDPAFEDNGLLYVAACTSASASGVYRHVFDPADYDATRETVVPIVELEEPGAAEPWHNVGAMAFDDEGALWVGFGDKTRSANAGETANALGGVLRIVPEREADARGYAPHPGNPLVAMGGEAAALYAWGLRSPWRLAVDAVGRVWVGDVGQDAHEEIDVIDGPGLDFGWPRAEGPCIEDCGDRRDPLVSWSHDDEHPHVLDDPHAAATTLRVAWVGLSYRPREQDRYDGRLDGGMLYGDACLGNLRIAELDAETGELVRDAHLTHLRHGTLALRRGPDDYLYGLSMGTCATSGQSPPTASFYRVVLR